ncbi:LOW QUALITY PROTEIN: Bystin, partial [Galemys pyrenaicus]
GPGNRGGRISEPRRGRRQRGMTLLEKAATTTGAGHHAEVVMDPDDSATEMSMNKHPPARCPDCRHQGEADREADGASLSSSWTPRSWRFTEGPERYCSGKIPKAFKIILVLSNSEQILSVTDCHEASQEALKKQMTQYFYNLVLLPQVLKQTLFQAQSLVHRDPAPTVKATHLYPLKNYHCGVITKCSIPVGYSNAAILKIAEMAYSSANSIFLWLLLDKISTSLLGAGTPFVHFLGFWTD